MEAKKPSELRLEKPDVYETLNAKINSIDFPCLFAKSSFNKDKMFIRVLDSKDNEWEIVSHDMIMINNKISNCTDEVSKSITTYLVVFRYIKYKIVDDGLFLIEMLKNLHRLDSCCWSNTKTKDPNASDFEFFFSGKVWFPVVMSPWHKSLIRVAPYLMVAIQPGDVFDFNKKCRSKYYYNMRRSIHKNIYNFYKGDLPYFLSGNSSGKNLWQYIGYDETADNKSFSFEKIESTK